MGILCAFFPVLQTNFKIYGLFSVFQYIHLFLATYQFLGKKKKKVSMPCSNIFFHFFHSSMVNFSQYLWENFHSFYGKIYKGGKICAKMKPDSKETVHLSVLYKVVLSSKGQTIYLPVQRSCTCVKPEAAVYIYVC